MSFDLSLWQRLEYRGLPVYLRSDLPHWFVPTSAGDRLLQQLAERPASSLTMAEQRFLQRLPSQEPTDYPGRSACLETRQLNELWLHVTNRCNLSCEHCLFSSDAHSRAELSFAQIRRRVDEALVLGCRVFALTGGEPFVHPDFNAIVQYILIQPHAHVAVLTNGMTLQQQLAQADWDRSRFHLQISVDGLEQRHDALRGAGRFARLRQQLGWLREQGWPFTLSMCVERDNVADMPAIVDLAAEWGAANVHFMWYFIRGRGEQEQFAAVPAIAAALTEARRRAQQHGMTLDNLDALRTQIFAPPGTIHDGSGSGWDSLAIGPDDRLYPSAALVDVAELATPLTHGLATAWRSSAVLEQIRHGSCRDLDSPWRFILGGGDLDHSYLHGQRFVGADPYLPLYEQLALDLIVEKAAEQADLDEPALRLKMGDVLETCGAHGKVALLHSNCLLSLTHEDSRSVVKNFYAAAVGDSKEEILNPVCYEADIVSHIPPAYRFRGYGCGSPVLDAGIQPGETILDLGCGSGVECFIAARLTGRSGRVIGVDMLEPMLNLAREGQQGVTQNLGYANLDFRQGYLEVLPVEDNSIDLILSNCVLNLSADKRRLFAEMLRVLKPGGRLVVADVVCETEPDAAIRNDEVLRGECIAGALTQKDLMGLLHESGFDALASLKRLPYRQVQQHAFFSLTFTARKPQLPSNDQRVRVMYPGPFAAIHLDDGLVLTPGQVTEIPLAQALAAGDQLYRLDAQGFVENIAFIYSCNCAIPALQNDEAPPAARQFSGCMVCGAPLHYRAESAPCVCSYCGETFISSVNCEQGHFVCDSCHSEDALVAIEHLCRSARETELLPLFYRICRHPAIPLHGPQYHALMPALILICYRNSGGELPDTALETALQRGAKIAGGSCAFNGVCGAAVGVGIAFSLILQANPLTADERQQVQTLVQEVLARLAQFRAARCCQRDCVVALQAAAELSLSVLPRPLIAGDTRVCRQQHLNQECLGGGCPLSPSASKRLAERLAS
ncbi:MAG: methyltransferase domain-containing protein [Desulfuromonadaceae bacterium]|nr:methyltransferase domain-containing protein [Desulfuromonadaceae bacterium]